MGFFKQAKDMKTMLHEAPGLVAQSQELSANAQAMAAAQQAASQQAMAGMPGAMPVAVPGTPPNGTPGEGDFAPIAGVSIELWAEISKSLAEVNYDLARGPEMAARKGVQAADWELAMTGWNARLTANPAVAQRFNALYTGRA